MKIPKKRNIIEGRSITWRYKIFSLLRHYLVIFYSWRIEMSFFILMQRPLYCLFLFVIDNYYDMFIFLIDSDGIRWLCHLHIVCSMFSHVKLLISSTFRRFLYDSCSVLIRDFIFMWQKMLIRVMKTLNLMNSLCLYLHRKKSRASLNWPF